jgi:hypothetical protein
MRTTSRKKTLVTDRTSPLGSRFLIFEVSSKMSFRANQAHFSNQKSTSINSEVHVSIRLPLAGPRHEDRLKPLLQRVNGNPALEFKLAAAGRCREEHFFGHLFPLDLDDDYLPLGIIHSVGGDVQLLKLGAACAAPSRSPSPARAKR